ncbi:MAG: hypothetical protein ACXU86_19170, partial [Archangium sp.]
MLPHGLTLLGFALLSVLHTWPLAAHLRGFLAGGTDDTWMNTWHLWWMRQALWVHPQNPFFSPLLHWPLGAQLYWHTLCPAKTALGVVLLPWLTPETAYNLLLIATFVATGYTSWLLFRYVLARSGFSPGLAAGAAFAGACAFDFSRYHQAHASAHLNLSSLEGIPLYLFFFFRYLDGGKRKDLLGLALSALFTILCDYYYVLYEALFSVVWVLSERWQRGPLFSRSSLQDVTLRRAALAGGGALLACLPMLAALAAHAFPSPISIWHGDSDYYADLVGFFLPDRLSRWVAHLPMDLSRVVHRLNGNVEEDGYYLGLATLAVCAYALYRGVPNGRRWAWIGVGFAILSLGTTLSWAGNDEVPAVALLVGGTLLLIHFSRGRRARSWARDTAVFLACATAIAFVHPLTAHGDPFHVELPLPYLLFKDVVPFFSRGGMPVRLELLTTLCMGTLVAFAAAHLGALLKGRPEWMRAGVALGVALVPNVEYLGQPMKLSPVPVAPPAFAEIRLAPPDVAVFTDATVMSQYEQTVHHHPISYARLSQVPVREKELMESSLYRTLQEHHGPSGGLSEEQLGEMCRYLRDHHFGYYILH